MLEASVSGLISVGGETTDAELGKAHYRLGRVYWQLGGSFRNDRSFAHKQWLSSAALWSTAQVDQAVIH